MADSHIELVDDDYTFTDDEINEEIKQLHQSQIRVQAWWDAEVAKYEKTVQVSGHTAGIPLRNYYNETATLQDNSIFPYHSKLYNLLDAYDDLSDRLYFWDDKNGTVIDKTLTTTVHAIQPFIHFASSTMADRVYRFDQQQGDDDENDEDSSAMYMPCSVEAVIDTLVMTNIHQSDWHSRIDCKPWTFWQVIDKLGQGLHHPTPEIKNGPFDVSTGVLHRWLEDDKTIEDDGHDVYIFDATSTSTTSNESMHVATTKQDIQDQEEQHDGHTSTAMILIHVLQHSLSDLQKDFRLAVAALRQIFIGNHCNNVSILRYLLVILMDCEIGHSEFRDSRADFYAFFESKCLYLCLGHSHSVVTKKHALCYAAFVRMLLQREFDPHYNRSEANKSSSAEVDQTSRIKQRIINIRCEDDVDDIKDTYGPNRVPVLMLKKVLQAVAMRAESLKTKMRESMDTDDPHRDLSAHESLNNCTRILSSASEQCVMYLGESDRFDSILGTIVMGLACCCSSTFSFDIARQEYYDNYYAPTNSDMGILNPFRYATKVSKANDTAIAFQKTIPVLRKIRDLFFASLVHVRCAQMGYGDWLLRCRLDYEITPLDHFLFREDFNLPDDESDISDEDDESINSFDIDAEWVTDEVGHSLNRGELVSRHDLSLLYLVRAWQAPWTPESHLSFQPQFRDAVATVFKSMHKIEFPVEVATAIASCLSRKWWPDERRQCWYIDCKSNLSSNSNISGSRRGVVSDPVYCSSCDVALYCSKKCQELHWKVSHKRKCGCPPFVSSEKPSNDELRFCTQLCEAYGVSVPTYYDTTTDRNADSAIVDEDIDDDDGSWESYDSADDDDMVDDDGTNEQVVNKTDLIFSYLKKHKFNIAWK